MFWHSNDTGGWILMVVGIVVSWAVVAFLLLVAFHYLVRAQRGRGHRYVPTPSRRQLSASEKQIPTRRLIGVAISEDDYQRHSHTLRETENQR